MRRLFTILYICIIAVLLTACGADTAMKKGDKFFALGEYYDAAGQYKKAYTQTRAKDKPLRGQRALKMADCYRRINYTQKAIAAYNNAVRYKQADSTSIFYLGKLQLKNGNYKDAEKTFTLLLDSMPNNPLVKNGLESARMAPKWKADAALSGYEIKKQELFNSRRAEFSPMLAGEDYDQLYFTSTRNQAVGDELSGITGTKPSDIFVAYKDEKGNWQKPEVMESELNTEQDEGVSCVTPDGKTMYLTVCKSDPSYPRYAKIATSTRSDASWGKAQEFEITKDTLSLFAHPAVSPDGMWLYFVSDMPGGLGGLDIWRAQLTTSGIGALENLGTPINTPGNEMFPTFRPNGDLYFSSDGHPGMGGLDIYIAKPNEEPSPNPSEEGSLATSYGGSAPLLGGVGGGLYTLEHPGFPLNSQGDDFGMTFEGLHNRGFFSSNRGDARGWDHIYSFEKHEIVQTVKGWVYEQDGYELPEALVYMVGNDGTNQKLSVKGDGSFTQEIHPGVDYVFLGTCRGFLNHKEQLKVDTVKESQEYVLQFPLASITAPVLIDNIFYDFDKATLRPESTEALDKLIALLEENPNVTIELSAHTDYRGSAAYNQRLSQRRAESVVNYLTEHGIAADRLSPMGYGKEKPKTIKRKLTEKYPWLAEGDVLTEEFITALKDEEKQEICNQLNRRTEFVVLRTTYGLFDKPAEETTSSQASEAKE
ncbi:OmpA family protein [Prevotella sp. E9-3]|uniref:OmpA family protein n=1 Tax=Prevotella sp. E9-3 TaxID=2913621 RepID=UPI001EDA9BA8|nr:OmpA family protein [Prevotella sp. E9-3]UKK47690.1 OmpA family protein [Prevotella sp. E9-3]